jgi:hypothetical protein
MAEKLDPRETVGLEEFVMSNVIEQEALVNLLVETVPKKLKFI